MLHHIVALLCLTHLRGRIYRPVGITARHRTARVRISNPALLVMRNPTPNPELNPELNPNLLPHSAHLHEGAVGLRVGREKVQWSVLVEVQSVVVVCFIIARDHPTAHAPVGCVISQRLLGTLLHL